MGETHGFRDPRRAAERRDEAAFDRDDAAGVRDAVSRARDVAATHRDESANARDAEAQDRLQISTTRLQEIQAGLIESLDGLSVAGRNDGGAVLPGTGDQAEAWKRGHHAAINALIDEAIDLAIENDVLRRTGAVDRRDSALDRRASARDRSDAAGDRDLSGTDREESAIDRELVDHRVDIEAIHRQVEAGRDLTTRNATLVSLAVENSRQQLTQSKDILERSRERRARQSSLWQSNDGDASAGGHADQ